MWTQCDTDTFTYVWTNCRYIIIYLLTRSVRKLFWKMAKIFKFFVPTSNGSKTGPGAPILMIFWKKCSKFYVELENAIKIPWKVNRFRDIHHLVWWRNFSPFWRVYSLSALNELTAASDRWSYPQKYPKWCFFRSLYDKIWI